MMVAETKSDSHRRQHSFLDGSRRIDGIIEILTVIQKEPTWFSRMCKSSRIKSRASNLEYLRYCKDRGLVYGEEKLLKIPNGRGYSKKVKYFTVYSITIKGQMVLEWLK